MSDQYDNTNRGSLFRVPSEYTLTGQGKVNIDGAEYQAVMVKQPISRNGRVEQVLYIKAAVMWVNDKPDRNPNAPVYSGAIEVFPGKRVAAWKKTPEGKQSFLSLAVSDEVPYSERDPEDEPGKARPEDDPPNYQPPNDDIPF